MSIIPPPTTPTGLKSFSFTHVQYRPDDILGKPMAAAALVPQCLIVSYLTLFGSRRDVAILFMGVGQLVNEAINAVAKTAIAEPRPTGFLGKGYGMPSSHAQFMAYFAAYVVLHFAFIVKYRNPIWKWFAYLPAVGSAVIVAYSSLPTLPHYNSSPRRFSMWNFIRRVMVLPDTRRVSTSCSQIWNSEDGSGNMALCARHHKGSEWGFG
ncbi:hypothetical protein HDU76_004039 [Blyttiomyces sp. JEL0837]|nr:hypothetical protein HDU76_004039 [Blyttiomyces sp. JEL0837]